MKNRFRITEKTTVKLSLYTKNGELLTTIYNDGYSNLKQCHNALLSKCCNPPKNTKFSVYNEDNDTYWNNL